jgi:hypothetical protein
MAKRRPLRYPGCMAIVSHAVWLATLKQTKEPQTFACPATSGRYLRLHILSEIHGGPRASIADLGVPGH